MATSTRYFCRRLFQVSRQVRLKRKCQSATPFPTQRHQSIRPRLQSRQFSTTLPRRAAQEDDNDEEESLDFSKAPEGGYKTPSTPITLADLDADDVADYNMLSPKDQAAYLQLQNHYAAEFEAAGINWAHDPNGELADPQMDKIVDDFSRKLNKEIEPLDFPDEPLSNRDKGFWALDEEDDEFTQVEDGEEEWDESAITSVAHSELDLHREIREYTRVIAWDMPLLQKFAKPFTPPTEATPLRFRYTTYMGEHHPAAHKVVLQFCSKDLLSSSSTFTEHHRQKLLKLVGPRYNPSTDVVKLSCEQFEAPAQNKRYLGDIVKKLMKETQDGEDSLEDILLDLRHHKPKKRIEFPESWKVSPRRVRELVVARKEQALLDEGQTVVQKSAVDGKELVHEYAMQMSRPPQLSAR